MNENDTLQFTFIRLENHIKRVKFQNAGHIGLLECVYHLSRTVSNHSDERLMEAVKLLCEGGYETHLKSTKPLLMEAYETYKKQGDL